MFPVTAVVTEMRFDTSSATPKLTFRAVRPLSVEELAESKAQGESADALAAVTQTVQQVDGDAHAIAEKIAITKIPIMRDSPLVWY